MSIDAQTKIKVFYFTFRSFLDCYIECNLWSGIDKLKDCEKNTIQYYFYWFWSEWIAQILLQDGALLSDIFVGQINLLKHFFLCKKELVKEE